MNWLARSTDWAVVLLSLEGIVVVLACAIGAVVAIRRLRWLVPRLRLWLFRIRLYVWKGARLSTSVVEAIGAPFVWLRGAAAGLARALAVLGRR